MAETKCSQHEKMVETLAEIKTDVQWLKKDREEQKQRYEKKRAIIRKVHYAIVFGFASCLGYLFENRENVRLLIREWLK